MNGSFLYLVLSEPTEGRAVEYNHWYDHVHLAEFSAIPGVTAARRYEWMPMPNSSDPVAKPPLPYLSAYHLVGDPVEIFRLAGDAHAGGRLPVSDALDLTTMTQWLFKARG